MIRKTIAICLLLGTLFSCKEDKNGSLEIVDVWKLVEVYMDPGDGSGDFQPVDSDKIIVFYEDGRMASNGELCWLSSDSNESSEGVYSESTGTISVSGCTDISYEISGSVMTLTYQCIEACQARYVR